MTAGTGALLLMIGGGAGGVAYLTRDDSRRTSDTGAITPLAAPAVPTAPDAGAAGGSDPDPALDRAPAAGLGDAVKAATGDRTSTEADRTATRNPGRAASDDRPATGGAAPRAAAAAAPAPVPTVAVTTNTVTETRAIPFRTRLVRDWSLPRGTSRVQTPGVAGVQTLRWLVTYEGGRETGRRLLDSTVSREPQERVVAVGGRGRGWGHGHNRECDTDLGPCIRLGRSACPDQSANRGLDQSANRGPDQSPTRGLDHGPGQPPGASAESGDELTVLDQGLGGLLVADGGLTPEDLAALDLACPATPAGRDAVEDHRETP